MDNVLLNTRCCQRWNRECVVLLWQRRTTFWITK